MITVQVQKSRDEIREKLKNDVEFQTHIGDLKSCTSLYKRVQDDRIRIGNRNKVKKDGSQQKDNPHGKNDYPISNEQGEFMKELLEHLKRYEDIICERFNTVLKEDEIYKRYLDNLPGIGPKISVVLLAHFRPENFYYASNLVSYAGIAPGHWDEPAGYDETKPFNGGTAETPFVKVWVPGKDRQKKGEKTHYPPFLKARLLGVMGPSFVKLGSPYSIHYYNYKLRKLQIETAKPEDERRKLFHINRMANRYMVKMFIIDYFLAASKIYGMATPLSWQEERGLEHVGQTYFTYEAFLDKELTKEQKAYFKDIIKGKRAECLAFMKANGWKEEDKDLEEEEDSEKVLADEAASGE